MFSLRSNYIKQEKGMPNSSKFFLSINHPILEVLYVVFPILDALREWLSSGIVGGLDTSIILDKQKVLSTSSLDILGESIDTGWWCGTCFMTFHLLGRIYSQVTNSYFSEG